jgi:hypothetical protein
MFGKFLNCHKENLAEWLPSDLCEPGVQHTTNADIISVSASVTAWQFSALTLRFSTQVNGISIE